MKKRILALQIVLFFLFGYSHGQQVEVQVSGGNNLEGAVVVFHSLTDGKQEARFTNNQGVAVAPKFSLPIAFKVSYLGYVSFADTIHSYSSNKKVSLVALPMSFDEVTITGNYTPGFKSNSIYNIDVISSKEIEQRAVYNVRDLMT